MLWLVLMNSIRKAAKIDGLSVTVPPCASHFCIRLCSSSLLSMSPIVSFVPYTRHVQLFEDIGKGSDMILMSVGDDKTFHLDLILFFR